MLNLPGYKTTGVEQTKEHFTIKAEPTLGSEDCPFCQFPAAEFLVKFGAKAQEFLDAPMRGKPVTVVVERQRYRCKNCGRTHSVPLPHLDEKRNMTLRLVDYIRQQALKRPFVQIASEVGVTEKTVRDVFGEYTEQLDEQREVSFPQWLGIDELLLANNLRCILTDVQNRKVIDILPSRDLRSVAKWLRSIPNPQGVEIVTMDMWKPYKDAAYAIFPAARVVVDKFHIVRMANYSVDLVRKNIRSDQTAGQRRHIMRSRFLLFKRKRDLVDQEKLELEMWGCYFPQLLAAYDLKEAFYQIWDESANSIDAYNMYAEWEAAVPDDLAPFFKVITTAVGNWHKEIFAYFDNGATNAYTECLNGIVKNINRAGRGYSFDVIRSKIIYADVDVEDMSAVDGLQGLDISPAELYDVKLRSDLHHSRFMSTVRSMRRDRVKPPQSTQDSD